MHRKTLVLRPALAVTVLFLAAFTTFGSAQTYSVIHSFSGSDGEFPYSGLLRGSDGNLYGTTAGGGSIGGGTVFKTTLSGAVTVVYSFAGGTTDGFDPQSPVVRDASGNIYGTTYFGGASNAGIVFKIDTSNHESVLYSFTGAADGAHPLGAIFRDGRGNIYGVTNSGGDFTCNSSGCGTVFRVDAKGKETVLHTFSGGLDGGFPFGGLIADSSGSLYGTTESYGQSGAGTAFKIDRFGTETILHQFSPGINLDGNSPRSDLTLGPGGILYGTTYGGGDLISCGGLGCGTVFEIDAQDVETTLHTFEGQPSDGAVPAGPITRDAAGNLYGTTSSGGSSGWGTVFKLDSSNNETVLYNFTLGTDGGAPVGKLLVTPNGTVFGTASSGGANGMGIVFRITE